MSTKTITVYVRKELDGNGRTLSFDHVPEISNQEALYQGYAIDGRTLRRTVRRTHDLKGKLLATMYSALLTAERDLWAWLEEKGYEVEFV